MQVLICYIIKKEKETFKYIKIYVFMVFIIASISNNIIHIPLVYSE